jgi:hypothetical protein
MKNLFRVLLLVVIVLVVAVQTRPDRYHVERSATMNAPGDAVFAQVNDFHKWTAWSPWEKLDPQMKRTFEGPESGVGAFYGWTGNKDVGAGSMKIIESTPPGQVVIDLEFLKPFKSSCVTTFTLAPEGAGTKLTWSMDGRNDFMSKAMCMFTSMDKMIGPDFERGLASLKGIAESAPAAADTTAPAAPTGMNVK